MQRRSYLTFILAAVFIAAGFVGVNAQSGTFSGKVTIKKKDGTIVPAAGMTIIAYRVDIDKGSITPVKTNDKGDFTFIGVNPSQKFVLLISGPGITPAIQPGFQTGVENFPIEVSEGNGSTFTEDEVRASIKSDAEMTPEEREKRKKLIEDNEAARKSAENNFKIVNAALKAGDEAYKAKNYDAAIASFDQGINADPDFAGSAPTLLNYKGVALKELGFAAYQGSIKGDKAAGLAVAKDKWDQASKAFERGLAVLAAAKPTDPKDVALYADTKKKILTNYIEVLRLAFLTQADTSKAESSEPIYKQYFEVETDPALKAKARGVFAEMMYSIGNVDASIAAHRETLASQPDNPDALAGIGIGLYTKASETDDKAMFQEAANYLGRFMKVAPENHRLKADADSILMLMKTEQKVTPKNK
jgi:tetratricopeptide (TPR) repeat protein